VAPIFSERWITQQGLNGDGATIVVPGDRVFIVRQLTFYAAPLLGLTTGHFRDLGSGASLWVQDATIDSPVTGTFLGALVFPPGSSFRWEVSNSFGEGADVFASGYNLTLP
jgi:hypothetical protein